MVVTVARLGHRPERDKRLSTHCALIARAFGASKLVYFGEEDEKLEESVRGVVKNWGGRFSIEHGSSWKKLFSSEKKKGAKIIHLTMYGLPFKRVLPAVKGKRMLVVIGSEKVPRGVYGEADYNCAITGQPHSEAGALAVFLSGLGLRPRFSGARLSLKPSARDKEFTAKYK
jgi:tRNA (cytidine56-2'-O)-methyltransferase